MCVILFGVMSNSNATDDPLYFDVSPKYGVMSNSNTTV